MERWPNGGADEPSAPREEAQLLTVLLSAMILTPGALIKALHFHMLKDSPELLLISSSSVHFLL